MSMNKSAAFAMGAAIGAVAALAYNWLLGPATGTTYDNQYASRLDHARAEGERVAAAKEAELSVQYSIARNRGITPPQE
jgi:hypothetical protein